MTWIFDVFVEGPLWSYDNSNIDDVRYQNKNIYFFWKVSFFFGSDKLFMTEIKSERAYNHVGTWCVTTHWKWQYFLIFWMLFSFFVVWENIDDLKFNNFLRGDGSVENQHMKKAPEADVCF